jgi:hypothetical protein
MSASGFPGNRVEANRAGITMTAFMAGDSIVRVNALRRVRIVPIGAEQRALRRRLVLGTLLGLLLFAAITGLNTLFSQKFFDATGGAQWIWDAHRLADQTPVGFFAARDFILPSNRLYTHIKIVGDPQYTLYFNGREIGGRRTGETSTLDVYDVSGDAHDGRNRVVVAVRSADGVGGLIVSIDLSPEIANFVVSDREWKIFRVWRPDLLTHDPAGAPWAGPMLIGRPPMGRWNYLTRAPAPTKPQPVGVASPRQAFAFTTELAEVRNVAGVLVVGNKKVTATAYDFGQVTGWPRITLSDRRVPPQGKLPAVNVTVGQRLWQAIAGRFRAPGPKTASPGLPPPSTGAIVIRVRYANDRKELFEAEGTVESVVFARGERTVVEPQQRHFRYLVVFGCCPEATADVLRAR